MQQIKVHFRLSTLVDCIFIEEYLKAILNRNVNFNIPSFDQILYAVWRISFFALGMVDVYCNLRCEVSRTSHWKKNCLYVFSCMYVLTYNTRSQINFLFKMWKLY